MSQKVQPEPMRFANFDAAEFLREYWQKKPLLIRNPWTEWANPLEPDELAGLACEPQVESRLITQDTGDFATEHGPLPEDRFGHLGGETAREPWTLLVQAVDHHIFEVANLLEAFRFIPNWRVDDVMVSYAVTGGGVGAHFDQYDVFLVQGLGTRRWQIGGLCDDETALMPHDDLRLLADFEPLEEWVLEPGDMLYVPPRFAHKGVAMSDDCMTYSVGFRAPSREELIEGYAAHVLDELGDDDRYTDPCLSLPDNAGEIEAAALSRLHEMMAERMADRGAFARWFAGYATQPKNAEIDWQPEEQIIREELVQQLRSGHAIIRNPASRFAFIRQDNGSLLLSVDGECIAPPKECDALIEALCAVPRIEDVAKLAASPAAVSLIEQLHGQGSIALEDPHPA